MRRDTVHKSHNSLLQNLMPFVILKFCQKHNINTFGDINLQPVSNNCIFGEHVSFLPIY